MSQDVFDLGTVKKFAVGKLAKQSIIILLVVIGAATSSVFSTFSSISTTSAKRIRTEARVIDVRRYPNTRRRKLWVQFEFTTANKRRVVSARAVRVKSYDAVAVGDRITIRYRKRRPRHARIASLRPPKAAQTKPVRENGGIIRYSVMSLLAFPILGFLIFLFVRRVSKVRATMEPKRENWEYVPPDSREAHRYERPAQKTAAKTPVPKTMGKAKQRAGWFD